MTRLPGLNGLAANRRGEKFSTARIPEPVQLSRLLRLTLVSHILLYVLGNLFFHYQYRECLDLQS